MDNYCSHNKHTRTGKHIKRGGILSFYLYDIINEVLAIFLDETDIMAYPKIFKMCSLDI